MRISALFVLLALPAAAQEATTRLQDAVVSARGSTISIRRLPIHTATGTIYRDVTIELRVDSQGRVSLATDSAGRVVAPGMPAPPAQVALQSVPSGAPVELPQRPSAPIVMQIFRAGTYTAPDGSFVHVSDRGNDLVHHLPAWSLSADGGVLASALWWSGPPEMNPKHARLKDADITGTDYAYGVSDTGNSEMFGSGVLIGVAQQGNTLRIVSYHHGCCSDQTTPVASLTYSYVGP